MKKIIDIATIHSHFYRSKKIFRDECYSIFKDICPIGFASGPFISPSAYGGTDIVITRHPNKKYAFYNVCSHRGCKLVSKDCHRKLIVCPYHSWSYGLDGILRKTSGFQTPENKNLTVLPAIERNNLLFGSTTPFTTEKLVDVYGNLFDLLDTYPLKDCHVLQTHKYDAKCNWKILIENFLDYPHLPTVHPALNQISKVEHHSLIESSGKFIAFKTDPLLCENTPLGGNNIVSFDMEDSYKKLATFIYIFPNKFMFLFPSHIFSILIQPMTPSRSIEYASLIVHKSQPDSDRIRDIWNFYDTVNKEDIDICEQVQLGIKTKKFEKGIFDLNVEKPIATFQDMYLKSMNLRS